MFDSLKSLEIADDMIWPIYALLHAKLESLHTNKKENLVSRLIRHTISFVSKAINGRLVSALGIVILNILSCYSNFAK